MKAYKLYINRVEKITRDVLCAKPLEDSQIIKPILNGQPSAELRKVISLVNLRQSGAFFTNHDLANKLIQPIVAALQKGATVFDPAAGTGNLLLACASFLPLSHDLTSTLNLWEQKLIGFDLHPEFVRLAKARLALLASQRIDNTTSIDRSLDNIFKKIKNEDFLSRSIKIPNVDFIVINPPYSLISAPQDCSWSSGIVSQAALFLEKCVTDSIPKTSILAILPDVLRTGSRYSKWRSYINSYTNIRSIKIHGRFDSMTDVDVFLAHLVVKEKNKINETALWIKPALLDSNYPKVKDLFKVNVGPVVPHRHPEEGITFPYLHAHQLPRWVVVNANFMYRKFRGTTFTPPFVVVRRTSRPEDKYRAVGTIITGNGPIAVENHLIVLKPKSETLRDCKLLIKNLRLSETNRWLNKRIRCRHLTVSALSDLPWWSKK